MNKGEFINHISELHKCTKVEAEKVVDMFTSSVVDAVGKDNDILLIGFGQFAIGKLAARKGHNPKTKESIEIPAYNQVRFRAGQKLKDAVNKDGVN